ALLKDAHQSSGEQGMPQVLLIITARFGRLFRKYRSLAYALVLKHVGVLYQNLYLVATNMGLAPCSLGAGDSDRFAQATGLNYVVESSVGEFMLGSLPHCTEAVIAAQGEIETSQPTDETIETAGVEFHASTQPTDETIETAGVGFPASTQPTDETANSEDVTVSKSTQPPLTEPISSHISAQTTEPVAMNSTALVSASEAKPIALHPHDLDERIPGLVDLRNQTLGDSRITIVILDGNADHSLSCFDGAHISKVFPYWHDTPEPISAEDYATYQEIDNSDLKGEEKQEKLKAALPETILKRIAGDSHACHITSTIVGQENTPSPGLAPNCRVINVPLNTTGKDEEFISVLNLSRAFELALDLGANIIHCAACRPTQTGEGEELLMKALKKCQDNNVLVVAPAGNNKGECWCMPAVLPGTLAVGAMKEDGVTPYKFSNWGGNYEIEGIMAPGGEILGAQPATEEPKRLKGTSMAAPVMTGLCSLLMSLQLQKGKPIDAEAVRAALLNTAIPCDPDLVEEPERCLGGFVNLPGAMNLLFGQPSMTISFTGEQVIRADHHAVIPAAIPPNITSDGGISSGQVDVQSSEELNAQEASSRQLNDRYTLELSSVHESTIASIYKAFPSQIQSNQPVAIKLFNHPIAREDSYLKLIRAEIKALSDLQHPHIVKLLDSDREENTGYPFLVLEWLPYCLEEILMNAQEQQLPLYSSWEQFYHEVGRPVLEALAHCHQHHYVHRDLHPSNLMWSEDYQLKLIDFGISRNVQQDPPGDADYGHLRQGDHQKYQAPEPEDNQFAYTRDLFAFGMLTLDCFKHNRFLNIPAPIQSLLKQCISLNPSERPANAEVLLTQIESISPANFNVISPSAFTSGAVTPSTAYSGHVYALGTIGYDFGSEARRDTFKQLMPAVDLNGVMVPANPYNARQMVDYLDQNPDEQRPLIWTLNVDLNPVYVLEPKGPFAPEIYEMLLIMLDGQIEAETSDEFIERVSIPARRTNRTVELMSGQVVPVITVHHVRGMYGWKVNTLVNAALRAVGAEEEVSIDRIRYCLTSFLNRVYYDLRNLGQTSRDRALNFAATNTFQAASTFAEAIADGRELDSIEVEKSPFCRINSDCWDVKLKFFDPENSRRARKVFRFTIDVAENLPVTLGKIKSWSVPK
ncbi:MAG: PatA/PatG family cyanobactin maturation protease, partial [Moorea sp. SIO2B7]|nr:PatA/PatG family cyanobactin maturation protease [Moorena sp. SIO2B7]